MNAFRIALIQVGYDATPGAMAKKYSERIAEAVKAGAKMVVLPELSMSPYFPVSSADSLENQIVPESILAGPDSQFLADTAKANGVFLIGSVYERGSMGFRKQKAVRYDTGVMFDAEGRLGAACRRQHLAKGGGYYDDQYFHPGISDYPIFGLPEVNFGLPVGYDQWFPEVARIYALKGAELLIYPTATGSMAGESGEDALSAWTTVLRSHAITNGVFVAAANRIGTEGNITFHGSSTIIAPSGEILAQGGRDTEEVVIADLDPAVLTAWKSRFPFLLQREPETYGIVMARLTENPSAEITITV